MKILGVFTGKDSGVAIIEDGILRYAANEERFSRQKMHTGFPEQALADLFNRTKCRPDDINIIALGGLAKPSGNGQLGMNSESVNPSRRLYSLASKYAGRILESHLAYVGLISVQRLLSSVKTTKNLLRQCGVRARVELVEHHLAHACSAYFTSGFPHCLVLTSDGGGDGISGGVYICRGGKVDRKAYTPRVHSAGNFWMYITVLLGMDPWRHGGKVTGLAAYEPSDDAYQALASHFGYSCKRLHFINRSRYFLMPAMDQLREILENYSPAQIAYAAQRVLEENMVGVAKAAVERYPNSYLALAGGTYANVRLNQSIFEIPDVEEGFVHPHMGDGGLAVGAAYAAWAREDPERAESFVGTADAIHNVYLGPDYSEEECRKALEKEGLKYSWYGNDLIIKVVDFLEGKKIIAHYHGKMEYGPRALGNRSILYSAQEAEVNTWLNHQLGRTEFMPFAPIVPEENANDYFVDIKAGTRASRFMAVTFNCTDRMKKRCPAAVHIDGTARPQILQRSQNPRVHGFLTEYGRRTGDPVLINTSFNMHEEPIVNTPQEAVRAFLRGRLDVLVLGNFIVEKQKNENRFR